ncbi:MAG: ATPase domain-containing protein [Methanomassiliicoccales archaeon]
MESGKLNVPSGVFVISLPRDELNDRLGGGIPAGSLMLLEGREGTGRSVLCQRLCYGLLENGRTVTFVSTEMTVKEFIDQMHSLDFKIADYLLRGELRYFPVYPLVGRTKARGDFLDKFMSSPVLFDTDALIVDCFSSLVSNSSMGPRVFDFIAFMKKVVSTGKAVVLTVDEGHEEIEPIRMASDILISLKMSTSSGGMQRQMHVKRFARARGRVQDIIYYRIEHKTGLVIELTEVSG